MSDNQSKIDKLETENESLKRENATLREKLNCAVGWSVEDFATVAEGNYPDEPQRYDPGKYSYALEKMISKHDAEIGITWSTVELYLEWYCLRDSH